MLRVPAEGAGESQQADRCSLLLLPGQPLEKSASFLGKGAHCEWRGSVITGARQGVRLILDDGSF